MRKLLLSTVTLAAVMCTFIDARAFDVKDKFMVLALGGLGIPVADFADDESSNNKAGGAKVGFSAGVAAEYGFTEQFLLGTRFAYHRFGVEPILLNDVISPSGAEARWTVVEFMGLYCKYLVKTGGGTRPYGRTGIFLGKPKLTVEEGTPEWSGKYDLSLGLEVAMGITQAVADNVQLGLEGRFAHLITNPSQPGTSITASHRQTRPVSPAGVRDPGGNIDWLAASAYLSYGF